MEVEKIFDYLEKFKNLPTYQFERRIDAFVLPYLEKAFNDNYSVDDFILLFPEFPLWPLQKNELILDKSFNRSVYADYLMWSKKLNYLIFVELKTDCNSTKQDQFDTYILNLEQGWNAIINDYYLKLINSIKFGGPWDKYLYGLERITDIDRTLTGIPEHFDFKKQTKNKNGKGIQSYIQSFSEFISPTIIPQLKLVYIAPEKAMRSININNNNANLYYNGLLNLSELAEYTDQPLKKLLIEINKT